MKKWSSALHCVVVFLSFLLVFPAGVVARSDVSSVRTRVALISQSAPAVVRLPTTICSRPALLVYRHDRRDHASVSTSRIPGESRLAADSGRLPCSTHIPAATFEYSLINRLAAAGRSVIMIGSELPELLGMSDRIIEMHEGQVKGAITGLAQATQEGILSIATV